ncbi:MAG: NapC/NirT family cytochrome c [Magnetospiraceae bacterium]
MADSSDKKPGLLKRTWRFIRRPSASLSAGFLLFSGIIVGILFWGGFHWSLELTNTETFCISCHEMEQNVYREYQGSPHDGNASGVRATCPDCHVPDPWIHKIVRKIKASNELYHHFLGTVESREKFEAKRLQLARNVWTAMKTTDSRECRNCHNFLSMDYVKQAPRARDAHMRAQNAGATCIDCHKGIAHELPEGAFEVEKELNAALGGAGTDGQ